MTDAPLPPDQGRPDQHPDRARAAYEHDARAAPADAAFEESLARVGASLRHRGSLPDLSRPGAPRPSLRGILALGALTLAIAAAAFFLRPTGQAWDVQVIAGSPTIDGRPGASQLRETQWLTTAAGERATLTVPSIGTVTIEPGSRVRLVRSRQKQQHMELARGTLHAFITAPPRLFVVDTPAARATDMGCIYTLRVEPDGTTLLSVAVGWVELSGKGGVTRVSAGLECRTSADGVVALPRAKASSLPEAQLAAFDPARIDAGALDALLASCGQPDGITLWHILQRVPEPRRAAVLDRLAALYPAPPDAPRENALALDRTALEAWWNQLR